MPPGAAFRAFRSLGRRVFPLCAAAFKPAIKRTAAFLYPGFGADCGLPGGRRRSGVPSGKRRGMPWRLIWNLSGLSATSWENRYPAGGCSGNTGFFCPREIFCLFAIISFFQGNPRRQDGAGFGTGLLSAGTAVPGRCALPAGDPAGGPGAAVPAAGGYLPGAAGAEAQKEKGREIEGVETGSCRDLVARCL